MRPPPEISNIPHTHSRESAQQIANRYDVSRRLVLNWYYSGLIPAAVHVGRVLRFDPTDVDKALQNATK